MGVDDAVDLVVQVSTTGPDPDDGYLVRLDGGAPRTVGANGTVTFPAVAVGSHSVSLDGISANCAADGAATRTVNVAGPGETTVAFDVACVAAVGTIRVAVSASGVDLDPDGYLLSIDGEPPIALSPDGTTDIGGVPAGLREVALSGVASNCGYDGSAVVSLEIVHGTTVDHSWTVECFAPSQILVAGGSDFCEQDLHLVDVEGATHSVLMSRQGRQRNVTWSPAGTEIMFDNGCSAPVPGLVRADASGSPIEHVGDGFAPAWSPDGSQIALEDNVSGQIDLFLMNPDGTGRTPMTNTSSAGERGASWIPDGSEIVYSVLESGSIAAVLRDGTTSRVLTAPGPDFRDSCPSVSPDGAVVAFTRQPWVDVDGTPLLGAGDLMLVNLDGTGLRTLTDTDFHEECPTWDPNGIRLAFRSDRDDFDSDPVANGTLELYTIRPDGADIRRIAPGLERVGRAAWKP